VREDGHAPIELALAVGVLLLPVALVVTGFGPWSERRVEAEAIAAEAARAAVLALSHEAGHGVVSSMTHALGIPAGLVRVGWCGAGPAQDPAGACAFERAGVVSIAIELWTPLVDTPWGSVGGLWVVGEHSEPIDLYRSLG
jgi:hypothetical protein